MEFEANIRLSTGQYLVQFQQPCASLSGKEADAIRQYGPLRVEFGGSFSDGQGLTLSLPTDLRSVPLASPYSKSFSIQDYGANSNAIAVLYRDTILQRIQTALAVHLAKDPGTLGRTVTNLYPVTDPSVVTANNRIAVWMDL